MFRRPVKNPEKDTHAPLYKEEGSANYLYASKKNETDIPPRIFDAPSYAFNEERSPPTEKHWQNEKMATHPFQAMVKEETPETTLGEGVTFRGELSFERLLRIDGTFEGELLSQGKVIIGPTGRVKANLNLREAIIEGVVEGNVTIQERLELRGQASIKGDIKAKSLIVDEGVSIIGLVEVSNK